MRKKLLTRTALAATIALGIGSFNLAYAAETEDTSSGKKINVMASFYPMYDFAVKVGGDCLMLIWQHFGKKEVYYIISAGLGEDIIERSLGDLNGFVEHLEEYKISGKIYAANVMDAGLVRNQSVFKKAYDMGYSVQNAEKLRVGE